MSSSKLPPIIISATIALQVGSAGSSPSFALKTHSTSVSLIASELTVSPASLPLK